MSSSSELEPDISESSTDGRRDLMQCLRSKEECQLFVYSCVFEKHLSLREIRMELEQTCGSQFSAIWMDIEKLYLKCFSERLHVVTERITQLCLKNDTRFFELCKGDGLTTPNSELWNYIFSSDRRLLDHLKQLDGDVTSDANSSCSELGSLDFDFPEYRQDRRHVMDLNDQDNGEPDEATDAQKQFVRRQLTLWLRHIKKLLPYFSPQKAESELLNAIDNWFSCNDFPHSHAEAWCKLMKQASDSKLISLQSLRRTRWPPVDHRKFREFKKAERDVRGTWFTSETAKQLYNYLHDLLDFKIEDVNTRSGTVIKLSQKILHLKWDGISLSKIRRSYTNLTEIRVYAAKRLVLEESLEQKDFHGINLSLVAETLVIKENCKIDLSGQGKNRECQQAKPEKAIIGEKGECGRDGEAGESSGNFFILVEQIINPEDLTVILVGGDGAGGQSGGDGGDGVVGKGVTKDEFERMCVPYSSLWRTKPSHFINHVPGHGFAPSFSESTCSTLRLRNSWVYSILWDGGEKGKGRQMWYSYSGDDGWVWKIYDLFMVVFGTDGAAPGPGGAEGLGGEGGKGGDWTIMQMSSRRNLLGVLPTVDNGTAGTDGQPGDPGSDGRHGNDMAMIDRSRGKGDHKYFFGGGGNFKLRHEWYAADGNNTRRSGFHQFERQFAKCYIGFKEVELSTLSAAVTAERRTEQRQRHSCAVAKQTILKEDIIFEFNRNYCGDDASFVMEEIVLSFDELEEDEAEDIEDEIQEELVVLRSQVEDRSSHELNALQNKLKPEDVIRSIEENSNLVINKKCLPRIIVLIEMFAAILSVPLDMIPLMKKINAVVELMESTLPKDKRICTGKKETTVAEYIAWLKTELQEKEDLSRVVENTFHVIPPPVEVELVDSELLDVTNVDLNGQLEEWNCLASRYKLIANFFKDVTYFGGHCSLIKKIHRVHKSLHGFDNSKKEYKDVFNKYGKDIDWSDLDAVRTHLKSFLKKEEVEKAEEAFEMIDTDLKTEVDNFPEPDAMKSTGGWMSKPSKLWQRYVDYMNSSNVFEDVQRILKNDGEIGKAFKELNELLTEMPYRLKLLTLDYGKTGNAVPVGSTPTSLIHMYFYAEKFMELNQQFFQCQEQFKAGSSVANSFLDLKPSTSGFGVMITKLPENYESPGSTLEQHLLENGLHSAAYRFLVAHRNNINLQVFGDSGYARMRLVESWNPEAQEKHFLHISPTGNVASIAADSSVREMRLMINMVNAEQVLKLSTESDLTSFAIPALIPIVKEWCDALESVTGSTEFHRFLRRLFELRGFSFTIEEFQFFLNTVIDLFGIGFSLETLSRRLLGPNGNILDICLPLRIATATRGSCVDIGALIKNLSPITEGLYRTLFGCKLQGEELTPDDLDNLVKMLSHADKCFSELEQRSLKDWVDIARCQRWTDYEPLLKKYGRAGYFFILLDSATDSRTKIEGKALRSIVDSLSKEQCFLLEKIVSRIAYRLYNHEASFVDDPLHYKPNVRYIFHEASEKAARSRNNINNGIHLVTEELVQLDIMDQMSGSASWDLVFSSPERTIEELIRLTVNPQDSDKEASDRAEQMQIIGKMVTENDQQIRCMQFLQKIDDAFFKVKGIRLRNVQKIAVLTSHLHKSNLLSQANTAEGKSNIIAALAILKKLDSDPRETIDIITSTNVLVQRDCEEMRGVYDCFEISVGHNCDENLEKRKQAYKCDVVYGDIAHFQRDYLIHNFYKRNILGERMRDTVIVDEVDCMLLDNGNSTLYLSHAVAGMELLEPLFVFIHKEVYSQRRSLNAQSTTASIRKAVLWDMFGLLTKGDIQKLLASEKERDMGTVTWKILINRKVISNEGVLRQFGDEDLKEVARDVSGAGSLELARKLITAIRIVKGRKQEIRVPRYLHEFVMFHLNTFIDSALRGLYLKTEGEYVIGLGAPGRRADMHPVVTIIDKGTGTSLASSQWNEGLHQFVQLKHGCALTPYSLKAVFISNPSYLKGYKKIFGFSGTLGSQEESRSLRELYEADIVRIPTWKPKIFNEKVPLLSNCAEDRLQNLYEVICDQFKASRSVLLICKTIADVKEIYRKLLLKAAGEQNAFAENFKTAFQYKRDYDDFTCSKGLEPQQLIISTNLAGRGADIKLSEALTTKGGLHVVITFLPENGRIEEQAYGRAARCGEPGSGQIIALVDKNASGAKNIFQLKQFRDNAEQHRLRSLKRFYDYHIEVEEDCLRRFQQHCSGAVEDMHAMKEGALPTLKHLVYYALLDKWAMWMDQQGGKIKKCEQSASKIEKEAIIADAMNFLEEHPLPKGEELPDWIDTPQCLLTAALIQMDQKNTDEAMRLLERIISDFPEFSPEGSYYLGVIHQQKVKELRDFNRDTEEERQIRDAEIQREHEENDPNRNWCQKQWAHSHIRQSTGDFLENRGNNLNSAMQWAGNIEDAPEKYVAYNEDRLRQATTHFLACRTGLLQRIWKKKEMAGIVSRLQQTGEQQCSSGYEAQMKGAVACMEAFLGNIEDMIGHAEDQDDFKLQDEPEYKAITRMRDYQSAGILSKTVMTDVLTSEMVVPVAQQHALPPAGLYRFLDSFGGSKTACKRNGYRVMELKDLLDLPMPSRTGFWTSLKRGRCFHKEQVCVAVRKDKEDDFPGKSMKKMEVNMGPFDIQMTDNNLADFTLYLMGDGKELQSDLNWTISDFLEAGGGHIEMVATLNREAVFKTTMLDTFDSVDEKTLAIELGIPEKEAEWILLKMVEENILEVNTEMTAHHTSSDGVLEATATANLSKVYVAINRFRFDLFPECMRPSLEIVFARQFSYGYMLKALKANLKNAVENEQVIRYRILLPMEPYKDLYQDLKQFGILHNNSVTDVLTSIYKPSAVLTKQITKMTWGNAKSTVKKIFRRKEEIMTWEKCRKEATEEAYPVRKVIYDKLEKKTPWMKVNPCHLQFTSDYLKAKCVSSDVETRKIFCSTFRQIAHVKKPNVWKWYLSAFLKVLAPLAIVGSLAAVLFLGPVALAIGLVVLAAVGTLLYFLSIMAENQKMFSQSQESDEQEELKVLLQSHSLALDKAAKEKKQFEQKKKLDSSYRGVLDKMANILKANCVVTQSEEILQDEARSTLEDAFNSSMLLPLLKQSIEYFVSDSSTSFVLDAVKNDEGSPTSIESTQIFFFSAFATSVIADANKTMEVERLQRNAMLSTLKTIGRRLEDGKKYEFCDVLEHTQAVIDQMKENSLAAHLTNLFWTYVEKTMNDAFDLHFWPMVNQEEMKRRSLKYSEERLALTNKSDFLARDLHTIFLKICFRSPKLAVLLHMVKYNYPMSVHVATTILKSVIMVLIDVGLSTTGLSFEFLREEQSVLTVSAGRTKEAPVQELKISLRNNAFYLTDLEHDHHSTKIPSGLYELLHEIEVFRKSEFVIGADHFQDAVMKKMESAQACEWLVEERWFKNEKLIPPVRF